MAVPDVRIGRDIFTTGQIAKLIGISARTVGKLFDAGFIKGYRIPGSNDRRVTAAQLQEFMAANGIPFTVPGGIVVVGHSDRLPEWPPETVYAADAFVAGRVLATMTPEVIVINASRMGRQEAILVARRIKADTRQSRAKVALVLSEDDADTRAVKSMGCIALRGEDGMCEARLMVSQEG